MKTDPTSYVLQTLKKVGPFDEWKNTPTVEGDVLRSDASLFKEYLVNHPQGRIVAREKLHWKLSAFAEGRIMLVGITEQVDKVRLVAREVVS